MKQLVKCPYILIFILHFFCSTVKKVFRVKFLLVVLILNPSNIFQEAPGLSFLLFLLQCYPLHFFPPFGLHAIYISAASSSMYTLCLAHVHIYFLFIELKFIEHLLCSRQCTKQRRARWVGLCPTFFSSEKGSLFYLLTIHSPTHSSLEFQSFQVNKTASLLGSQYYQWLIMPVLVTERSLELTSTDLLLSVDLEIVL